MRQNMTHILLVEPRPEYAIVTAGELSKLDCEVALARTPDEGRLLLNTLRDHSGVASLILVDVSTGDGCNFAAELFNHMMDGTLPLAPIIGLAPIVSLEIEAAAHAAGCDFVLRAPLGPGGAQLIQQLSAVAAHDEALPESLPSYAEHDAEFALV